MCFHFIVSVEIHFYSRLAIEFGLFSLSAGHGESMLSATSRLGAAIWILSRGAGVAF